MNIKGTIKEVVFSIIPIALIILILNYLIVKMPSAVIVNFILGLILTILGLILFLIGINVSLLPIGQLMGSSLMKKVNIKFIIAVSLAIGFVLTFAEPGVQVLADQIQEVSRGELSKYLITIVTSLGLSIFLVIAILRMIFNISIKKLLLISYIIIFIICLFTPEAFFTIAFDASGATTGPVTVPFVLALGAGLTAVQGTRKSSHDAFGIIGLASVGPILAILLLGVIIK
ncbi:MAG: DUF1538 domain-containing protein [Bacilli bacterium]